MAKKSTKDEVQELVANCDRFEEHHPKLGFVNVFHVFPIFVLSKTHQ